MQDETIRTLEGGNLAELVELQVLGGRVDGVDLNDLEVDLVGLRDGADGRGASVSLLQAVSSVHFLRIPDIGLCVRCDWAYIACVELSERHLG